MVSERFQKLHRPPLERQLDKRVDEFRAEIYPRLELMGALADSGRGYSLVRELRHELEAAGKAELKAERESVKAWRQQIAAAKRQAWEEERAQKRAAAPLWKQKREAERDFRHVQLQMVVGTRAHAKYIKNRANASAHLQRQLPKMVEQVRKRDRPRCGFPCGHPLRPRPCQAPVVAGRHPVTGAPILGKHCRKHGGWM